MSNSMTTNAERALGLLRENSPDFADGCTNIHYFGALRAIESALSQAQQGEVAGEFVGYGRVTGEPHVKLRRDLAPGCKLYTAPPAPAGYAALSLLANAVDNLNDLPINEGWSRSWTKKAEVVLAAQPGAGEGFVLVPSEPTKIMLDAARLALGVEEDDFLADDARTAWDAMLTASQHGGGE